MAGRRRRRRRHGKAHSSQLGTGLSPLADATLSTREVTTVEIPPKNACHASGSISSISSGPYVCADLLDTLLHEIIVLINSFHDFVAFIGTCRSWRASVSSFPSLYTFSFPPLHLKPDGPYFRPHSRGFRPLLLSKCKWQLSDPCKKSLSLRRLVTQNTPDTMHYLSCSYGYLIFTYEEYCLLVDAYTGAKFNMQRVAIMWQSLQVFPGNPWLVPCGDMFLMVELTYLSASSAKLDGFSRFFEIYRLDLSVEPAKWVKMEKLGNPALFVSYDKRNPAFSCMNPERWGGKSNCIYVARLFHDDPDDETWTAVELGQLVRTHNTSDSIMYGSTFPPDYSHIGSLWLFPSLVYGGSSQ
ncbi:unnamed protein product [Urochloa decumbens]|uniref:KIB1-4 beta-propeller domain-containing protein n=1 Tax=Urochloa decumbens TaxID=240449 RepID=A0ABC8W9L3_9POAL